jgi:prefoldin subunit 5
MSNQKREAALKTLQTRRNEIRRALTAVEQQIQRTHRQVQVIQQQITSLRKGPKNVA